MPGLVMFESYSYENLKQKTRELEYQYHSLSLLDPTVATLLSLAREWMRRAELTEESLRQALNGD